MSEPTPKFTMTIDPKKEVLDIDQGKLVAGNTKSGFPGHPIKAGTYQLTYKSNVTYRGANLPVNKCIVYNTTDDQPGGWFYLLDEGASPLTIVVSGKGRSADRIWAFVVDIKSQDNKGEGTVTVTPVG